MKRRLFLQSTLGLGALGAFGAARWLDANAPGAAALAWRERSLLGFGTTLSLKVAHADAGQAERALDAAVETIRHVEAQMSLFRADSALARLNRAGVLTAPDPDLVKVLELARTVSARSGGTFDVTVQPL